MHNEEVQCRSADVLNNSERAKRAISSIVEAKDDGVPIETNAGSLRSVAVVLESLEKEVRRCGGNDCMGRAVDGVKLWVTMDQLTAARARADQALDRVKVLEKALLAILAQTGAIADYSMLTDWQTIAIEHQSIAKNALEECQYTMESVTSAKH